MTLGAAILAFFLAFYLVPRLCRFKWWWLTRSIYRLLAATACLLPILGLLLLLPWLEAAHGVGFGVSVLPVFQVEYRYLDCRGVEFSHQAYLWGDFAKAASEPAIFLIIYQTLTLGMIFAFAALITYLIHFVLVKRSMSAAAGRLGRLS